MFNMREWQLFEQTILDEIDRICRKYKLRYYLSSGTLLGAVRHKGFIPWDDDIDVDMPIEDYKKFCRIAQKELGDKYFFQNYKTDPMFPMNWAMVRANNTTSMPVCDKNLKIHWGAHVDIFPIIGIYDNERLKKIQKKLYDINITLLERDKYLSGCFQNYVPNRKIRTLYKLPRWLLHFLCDLNNLFIDKKMDSSEHLTLKGALLYGHYERKFFVETTELEFEGKLYFAPKDYDGQLTLYYGDYMTPPPEDKRGGHEQVLGSTIRDLTKHYTEYQNDKG